VHPILVRNIILLLTLNLVISIFIIKFIYLFIYFTQLLCNLHIPFYYIPLVDLLILAIVFVLPS